MTMINEVLKDYTVHETGTNGETVSLNSYTRKRSALCEARKLALHNGATVRVKACQMRREWKTKKITAHREALIAEWIEGEEIPCTQRLGEWIPYNVPVMGVWHEDRA